MPRGLDSLPKRDAEPRKTSRPRSERQLAVEYNQELMRARGLERTDKLDEARAVYERLLTLQPGRYEAYHRLGVVADRQRRYREAEALYTQAIRMEPENPDLFNDLGYCMFLQGKLEKAELAILKAVSLSPSNPKYRNNLGLVYGHQRRYEDALDQFQRAGSAADAYYNLAFVMASQDEMEEAMDCFRLALAVDPTYEKARLALKSFKQAEQDPEGLLDNSPIVRDGIRWEPYVEGNEAEQGEVQPAAHTSPSTAGRLVPSMRPSTQAELNRARSMWAEQIQAPHE